MNSGTSLRISVSNRPSGVIPTRHEKPEQIEEFLSYSGTVLAIPS